jgi:hypothetical protein
VGNAGQTPIFNLDKALERGNLRTAWIAALEASYIPIDRALLLTILMGRDRAPGYERAARRFLVRFLQEVEPGLEQVKRAADALAVLGEPEESLAQIEARKALGELAKHLKELR